MINLLKRFFNAPGNRMKRISQIKDGEDIIACVAMLLNFYGHNINVRDLRKSFPEFIGSRTVEEIEYLCEKNNLITKRVFADYLDLKKAKHPLIIFWRMKRFVILLGVDHEKYLIYDPANERIEYQEYEVECYYCEVALQVTI